MEWRFRVNGIPATQGSKKAFVRGGKVSMVEVSKKLPAWRADVAAAAREVADTDGTGPLDFPLEVKLDVYLPVPKKSKFGSYPAGPPDVDKLQRAVGDALKVGGLIRDDARICRWVAEKHWSDEDHPVGCEIRIRRLDAAEVAAIAAEFAPPEDTDMRELLNRVAAAAGIRLDAWQEELLVSMGFGSDEVHTYSPTAGHAGHNYAGGEWTTDPGDLPGISQTFGPPPEDWAESIASTPIHPGWFHGVQRPEAVVREFPISRESAELFLGRLLPQPITPEQAAEAFEEFKLRSPHHAWVSNEQLGFRVIDPVLTETEDGYQLSGTFPEFLLPFLRAGQVRGVSVSIDGDPETTLSATLVPDEEDLFERNMVAFRKEPRLFWGLDGDLSKPFPDEPENRMEAGL